MNLLIRADADAQMGLGHVMRCLALAQAWQDAGGQVTLATAGDAPAVEAWWQSQGMAVVRLAGPPGTPEDARQTVHLAAAREIAWIVVDGYHLGGAYQQIIKAAGKKLLCLDDNGHADHYFADIVLNQNLHAREDQYRNREPYTCLLLGTDYVLLRREFLKWRQWPRQVAAVARRILVTMGGSDPANVTLKVLRALGKVKVAGLEVLAVVGADNPHYQELNSAMKDYDLPGRLAINVKDMAELMAWADLAVSAGGSTCWELAFMGLPSLILVLADNQRPVAASLEELGLAANAGWFRAVSQARLLRLLAGLIQDQEKRRKMSTAGRLLVDGRGPREVVQAMLS
jgi:UDP-2,4-diacetamido-2,4,6-trideoxy-beta-L-altropyranose hydrolase